MFERLGGGTCRRYLRSDVGEQGAKETNLIIKVPPSVLADSN